MSNTETLTLAKALAVKNRLAGRLAQAKNNIQQFNCVQVGQRAEGSLDVRAEFQRYIDLQRALVAVKTAIQHANTAIFTEILQLAELKSTSKMLSELDTKQGKEASYHGTEMEYDSVFKKPEVMRMIRELEGQVDTLQDRLNQHNAANRIEIDAAILDLAR